MASPISDELDKTNQPANDKTTLNLFKQFISSCLSKYQLPQDKQVLKGIAYVKKLYKERKGSSTLNSDECFSLIRNCLSVVNTDSNPNSIYPPLLDLVKFLKPISPKDLNLIKNSGEEFNDTNSNDHLNKIEEKGGSSNIEPQLDKQKIQQSEDNDIGDDEDYAGLNKRDKINLKRIKKLDNFCMKLNQKIIELERKELCFNELESENSNYIVEGKLKRRFNEAYSKLVSLMKKNSHLIDETVKPRKVVSGVFSSRIKFNSTRYKELNQFVETMLNKTKSFPDFFDVTEWIKEANEKSDLGFDEKMINVLGKDVLKDIGRLIKERRKNEDKLITKSRIDSLRNSELTNSQNNAKINEMDELNQDPAEDDSDLQKKLEENHLLADEKEKKILEDYVKKQEENLDYEVKTDEEEEEEYEELNEDTNESFNFEIENDIEPSFCDIEDFVPKSEELDPKVSNIKSKDDTMNEENLEEFLTPQDEQVDEQIDMEPISVDLLNNISSDKNSKDDIDKGSLKTTSLQDESQIHEEELDNLIINELNDVKKLDSSGNKSNLKRNLVQNESSNNDNFNQDGLEKQPRKKINLNGENTKMEKNDRKSNDIKNPKVIDCFASMKDQHNNKTNSKSLTRKNEFDTDENELVDEYIILD